MDADPAQLSDSGSILWSALSILGLLACSAFFSGSETALTATSRARIMKLSQDGDGRADTVLNLISDKERLIGAILLGNNLVNILAAILSAGLFAILLENAPEWVNEEFATTLVMTLLVLIFAEVTPKSAAIAGPDRFAMFVAPVMIWIVRLLAPVTRIIQFIVSVCLRILGVSTDGHVFSAADEIRGEIELHHVEGRVEKTARDMLKGALDLDDIRVSEIMVHRKNMNMIDIGETCLEIVRLALESPHTRIPLYKENAENIVGVLHAKDVLRALFEAGGDAGKIDIHSTMRQPYFVPESTSLQEQLDAFREKKEHFALIVDEYGAL
ncbi:MAG: CNNM domain-containing protein, partial [Pseudomonadota bacterium]